ncbi:MAG: UDP-N-acetylmuramoyl-L-alanine--D-glutamate ligase [Collinsella sp.]|nr:UDP-N-acetylmuramoyl-L-alanine--D-glutamate ligase [Collinsella sp.]
MLLPQTFSLLVLGQGSTGLDVVAWALRHADRVRSITVYGGGSSTPSDDTRRLEAQGVDFVYGTESVVGVYDVCVASPGISEFSLFFDSARRASALMMGEPEFAFRLSPERWCAITGTNGKTTTTSLIHHLLVGSGMAASAVGNIGRPTIDAVDGRVSGDWIVAELSSYQLATTSKLHPRVAVLLNITPDHLSWHGSLDNYAAAKAKLFENMGADDLAIVNVDDEGVHDILDRILVPSRRVLSLSREDSLARDAAFVREGGLVVRLGGVEHDLVPVDELGISGEHNVMNALAASAAAIECGADLDDVRAGLRSFAPLEHRIEPCGEIDGVRYFNDSKATNTDAVEKALTAFPDNHVILMLGGHDKGTPLEGFADVVIDHVAAAVCFGEARARFRKALEDADGSNTIDIAEADDLRDALDVARSLASRGDVVLLSPACSSYDEFLGYEERGRFFKARLEQIRSGSDLDDASGVEL